MSLQFKRETNLEKLFDEFAFIPEEEPLISEEANQDEDSDDKNSILKKDEKK